MHNRTPVFVRKVEFMQFDYTRTDLENIMFGKISVVTKPTTIETDDQNCKSLNLNEPVEGQGGDIRCSLESLV